MKIGTTFNQNDWPLTVALARCYGRGFEGIARDGHPWSVWALLGWGDLKKGITGAPATGVSLENLLITAADLNKYLGQSIDLICGNAYANPHDNHCAHFVSHAMSYKFGYTCQAATGGKSAAANLRVHELFSRCPAVGKWANRPAILTTCLVFVTGATHVNVATKTMSNIPKKHIGIFINGTIWHYSNSHHKVVTQQPGEFVHHYPGPGIELFYGQLIP